jgi:hypothetical protein
MTTATATARKSKSQRLTRDNIAERMTVDQSVDAALSDEAVQAMADLLIHLVEIDEERELSAK